MGKILLSLILCLFSVVCCADMSKPYPARQLNKYISAPPSDGPMPIYINTDLTNIISVDEQNENFSVELFMSVRWQDKRLAFDPTVAGTDLKLYQSRYDIDEVYDRWRPLISVSNGIGERNVELVQLAVEPDGMVTYVESFNIIVELPMNLKYYPFDKHELFTYINIVHSNAHPIRLIKDNRPNVFARPVAKSVDIAQWHTYGITHKIVDEKGGSHEFYRVGLTIEREPLHVLINVYLPMFVFTILSFIVLWLHPKLMSERINLSLVGLISIVTYQIIVQQHIPPVGYLLAIDGFIFLSFLFVTLNISETLLVNSLYRRDHLATANTLDRICRYLFPTCYVIFTANIMFFCIYNSWY